MPSDQSERPLADARPHMEMSAAETFITEPDQPDRCEIVCSPLRSLDSVRSPGFGTNGSQTGALIDPLTNSVAFMESSIEMTVAITLLADPFVRSVRHQPFKIKYVDEDGSERHHTVDLLAILHDGTRIGYVVKTELAAHRHNTRELVERLARFASPSVVDRLQLVTSRQLPEWGSQNARRILSARRDRRTHVDDALRDVAPELVEPVRIGALTARLGGGAVAFRPILRAIYNGTLTFCSAGLIDQDSLVKFSGTICPDTATAPVEVDRSLSEPPVIARFQNKSAKRTPSAQSGGTR